MKAAKINFALMGLLISSKVMAFCGFYVAKADTGLFNEASKVVLVRDDEKTVLTMSNDFQGDVNEFATVIPVPTVLEKGQIHVAESKLIDHLDAYTAPRLVEYFDEDPCNTQYRTFEKELMTTQDMSGLQRRKGGAKKNYNVTIEAEYTVGEYDIVILSAKESGGLKEWLIDNGYKIPAKAEPILESYIKQDLKFFVAKVNLKEHSKLGFTYLRPLQVAYESKKFTLPIRLGMANAKEGKNQDLFVFAITKKGKVESTNYRTVKLPSNVDIPPYVKEKEVFTRFYKDMFETSAKKEDYKVLFMEYAWNMNWCDPCAADPLSASQLKELGVFWLNDSREIAPQGRMMRGGAVEAFVTRLHVRYNEKSFPDDIRFNVTADQTNFQGRYILRHPFKGELTCEEGKRYKENLLERQEKERTTLAHLTGWSMEEIRKNYADLSKSDDPKEEKGEKKWWEKIW